MADVNLVIDTGIPSGNNASYIKDANTSPQNTSILAIGQNRVGVGTTSPLSNLHIYGSDYPMVLIQSSNASGGDLMLSSNSNSWEMYLQGADLMFYDGSDNRMTLKNGGNIGIGTTSPGSKLEVNGARGPSNSGQFLVTGDNDHAYIQVRTTDATSMETGIQFVGNEGIDCPEWTLKIPANSDELRFNNKGADLVTISATTGAVGIGYTSPSWSPGELLYVRKNGVSDGSTVNHTNLTFQGDNHFNSLTEAKLLLQSQAYGNNPHVKAAIGWGASGVSDGGMLRLYTCDTSAASQLRMVINESGYVGIGSASPSCVLDVVGTTKFKPASDNTTAFQVQTSGGTPILNVDTTNSGVGIGATVSASTLFVCGGVSIGWGGLWSSTAAPNYGLMVEGRFGIGATNPPATSALHVEQNGGAVTIWTTNGQFDTVPVIHFRNPYNNNDWVLKHDETKFHIQTETSAGSEKMTIVSSGEVGIGTTSPSEKFEVYPDTDNSAKIGRAYIGYCGNSDYACFSHIDRKNSTDYALQQDYVGNTFINAAQNRSVYFLLNNSYKMVLNQNGDIGIGTTQPGAKLDVRGSAIFNEDGGDNDFRIEGDTDANLLVIDASADKIGIGMASPANKLSVAGAVSIGSNYAGNSAPSDGAIIEGNVGIGLTSPASGLHIGVNAGGSNKGFITLEELSGSPPSAPGSGKAILYMRGGYLCTRVGTGIEVQLA